MSEDFSAYSLQASAVYTFTDSERSAFALAGVGAYHLGIVGDANPYGPVQAGLHVGIGALAPTSWDQLILETQLVALLTDYGAGAFNLPVLYVPITVGVRF